MQNIDNINTLIRNTQTAIRNAKDKNWSQHTIDVMQWDLDDLIKDRDAEVKRRKDLGLPTYY